MICFCFPVYVQEEEVTGMDSEKMESKNLSVREAGRRGGEATKSHLGLEHFKRIGSIGGKRTAFLYRQLLKEFGRKGGRPRSRTINW